MNKPWRTLQVGAWAALMMIIPRIGESPAAAADLLPGNLVPNPGFEQLKSGFPAGWRTFDEKARRLVRADRETAFAGQYALRLTGDPGEAWLPVFTTEAVRVAPGTQYTLAGYSKSVVTAGGSILFALREISEVGQSIRFSELQVPLENDWAFYSRTFTMSEETASVQVFLALRNCEGMAWFDDLILIEGELPDVERLAARTPRPPVTVQEVPLYANLLENNRLQAPDDAASVPTGWQFSGAPDHQGVIDRDVFFTGNAAFWQTHPAPGLPGSFLHPVEPPAITPNDAYRLSARLMTSPDARSAWTTVPGARGQRVEGACLQLLFLDENGEIISQVWSRALQTNGEWRELSVVGEAPGNAAAADVRLFHGDLRGSSWFDAVRLERIASKDDLRPLWALPRDVYPPGQLPPAVRLVTEQGTIEGALGEGGTADEYSLVVRSTGAGALQLPPVDNSFPGTFGIRGEIRALQGAGEDALALRLEAFDINDQLLSREEHPLAVSGEWSAFSLEYTPDLMAAKFTVALAVFGGEREIELRGAAVEQLERLTLQEYIAITRPAPGADDAPVPGVAQVNELRFTPHNGIPTLLVNGRPRSFSQLWHSSAVTAPMIAGTRRAGLIHVITLDRIDWSADPPVIDPEELDGQVRQVLAEDPQALIIISPDTTAEHGRISWVHSRPEECYVNDLGESTVTDYGGNLRLFPSFASVRWQQDVNLMLEKLVTHVNDAEYAERIIGYQLSGYEWFHWEWMVNRLDYSVHSRDAFRRWLQERYDTPQNLQNAWGRPGLTFDAVLLPTIEERRNTVDGVFRDPVQQRHVADFSRFYNELIADVLIGMARTVKQTSARPVLTGCFYGYVIHFFDTLARESTGHLAFRHLMESGLVDFGLSPSDGYLHERGIGGTGGFMTAPGSFPLHNALYVDQPDFRTHWSGQTIERTDTIRDDVGIFRRELALALTNDVPIQYYDFSFGYTIGERRLVEDLHHLSRIEDFSLSHDRRPTSEGMAVIVSEETADFVGTERALFDARLLYHQRPLFFRSGMPHRYYLLSDLENPNLPDHRIWVFPNAFRLNEEEKAWIRDKCMRNGNVLVFVYAPGIVDEQAVSVDNMSDFLGINITPFAGHDDTRMTIRSHADSPWLRHSPGITWGQGRWSPLYRADDPQAHVIGTYSGTDIPGLVWKDFGEYKVVYAATPQLPPDLLRDLGELAGAHVYSDTNDALYADRNFVGLHARTPGLKHIRLPRRADVYDLFNRRTIARDTDEITVDMQDFTTAFFYVGDAAAAEAFFGNTAEGH